MSAPTLLYLVRHGATESNLENPPRLQGRSVDLDLAEEGRNQAAATADWLAREPLTAVYCSPLRRAKQTAETIATRLGLPVVSFPELTEIDVGRWERRNWDEIARDEPDLHARFHADPGQHGYAGGENFIQVRERVAPLLERLVQRHAGERFVVVSHNVVNRVYLMHLLGMPWPKSAAISQDNCCVNVIRFHGGEVKVKLMNSTVHLCR